MFPLYISGHLLAEYLLKIKATTVGTRCKVFLTAQTKHRVQSRRDQSALATIQGKGFCT